MNLPEDFRKKLDAVTNKRARFVIDKILENGFCSTQDLKNAGYEHAPRAARDVRELGIPLETFKIKDDMGKTIAAYKFGDWENAKKENLAAKTFGRTHFTQKLKKELLEKYGPVCCLYGETYPARLLQPDHRVPYEIGGNNMALDNFMLLSPSANRDKSWACEHCVNWKEKNILMCKTCYYAYPEKYEHIVGKYEKRVAIVFKKEEFKLYENLVQRARKSGITYQDEIKRIMAYYEKVKRENK